MNSNLKSLLFTRVKTLFFTAEEIALRIAPILMEIQHHNRYDEWLYLAVSIQDKGQRISRSAPPPVDYWFSSVYHWTQGWDQPVDKITKTYGYIGYYGHHKITYRKPYYSFCISIICVWRDRKPFDMKPIITNMVFKFLIGSSQWQCEVVISRRLLYVL